MKQSELANKPIFWQVPLTPHGIAVTEISEHLYHSRHGGLWPDRKDADTLLAERLQRGLISATEAELLRSWMRNGYVILRNTVPQDILDDVVRDTDRIWETSDSRLLVHVGGMQAVPPNETSRFGSGNRLVDLYVFSEAAREAIFAYRIRRFLQLLFEDEILAFQGLSFERGSEQAVHQDTAYVVVSSPLKMAACWIALEDIEPGSGELCYYEGSHHLPDFPFRANSKHWNSEQDGDELHQQFLDSLHVNSKAMKFPLRKFQPKRGDVLLWHADSADGGAEISHPNSDVSRRSLVAHYCPISVTPHYFTHRPMHRGRAHFKEHCYYSSYYYPVPDSLKLPRDEFPPDTNPQPREVVLRFARDAWHRAEPYLPSSVVDAMKRYKSSWAPGPKRHRG